jgi:hypothetical protein
MQEGHKETSAILIAAEAKTDMLDKFQRNPMHYATERDHTEISTILSRAVSHAQNI